MTLNETLTESPESVENYYVMDWLHKMNFSDVKLTELMDYINDVEIEDNANSTLSSVSTSTFESLEKVNI